MNKHLKHHIAAITAATTLLALLATAAPARNFSTSNQNVRVVWTELEFAALVTITCSLTFEGSFHYRSIVKRERALIGYITAAIVRRPCRNGEAWAANGRESHPRLGTLANTLPWHITYEGFAGTLPNITSILFLVRGGRFKIHSFFDTLCLYGDANDNITGRGTRDPVTGAITGLEPVALVDAVGQRHALLGGCRRTRARRGRPGTRGRRRASRTRLPSRSIHTVSRSRLRSLKSMFATALSQSHVGREHLGRHASCVRSGSARASRPA